MMTDKVKSIEKTQKAPEPSFPPRASALQTGLGSSAGGFDATSVPQMAGNMAVQQLLRAGGIQAKLAISQPGDSDEQEADRVAQQVMSMPAPSSAVIDMSSVQRQPLEKDEVQTKPLTGTITPLAQCAPSNSLGWNAPRAEFEARLSASGGSPLPAATRAFMESRFGANFSQVRVHTDGRAAESANSIGAKAFTYGRDVVFGAGEYAPESGEGKKLLAHELTHVVQQCADVGAGSRLSAGASNRAVATLARQATTSGEPNFTPAPTVLSEVQVEGNAAEGRRFAEAKDLVRHAMQAYANGFLHYKTNLSTACALFMELVKTPSVAESTRIENVMKSAWEKAFLKVTDSVVKAVGEEVPMAEAVYETGKLVVEEFTKMNLSLQARTNFLIVQNFQLAASKQLGVLIATKTTTENNIDAVFKNLPDPGAEAIKKAQELKAKADAALEAIPSADQIYSNLAAIFIGESYSVSESGYVVKDTITTGKLSMVVFLDRNLQLRSKIATIAVPGEDRIADALFRAGDLDVLQLPMRRTITIMVGENQSAGDIHDMQVFNALDAVSYELMPGSAALDNPTRSQAPKEDAGSYAPATNYVPASLLLKRGETTFVPSFKS
jgi:hypothetical protein